MLLKKILYKVLILTVIYIVNSNNSIDAVIYENNISDSFSINSNITERVTEEKFETIEKLLEHINLEVKDINKKIARVRNLPEYDIYPAVRLNIDTPYFGLNSIINSRLKIRDRVSTIDIATGYSINTVISRRVVKVVSFEVSNIVITTREIKINKNMSLEDANICINMLLNYLNNVKDLNYFVDRQLETIISGYFTKERNININKINTDIQNIEKYLIYSLEQLSFINAITEDDLNIEISKIYDYIRLLQDIKNNVNSIYITDDRLEEIIADLNKTRDEVNVFKFNTNNKYNENVGNIDLEKAVYLVNLKMNNDLEYIHKFVDDSVLEIEEETAEEIVEEKTEILEEEEVDNDLYIFRKKEYLEIYNTTSENIIESMKNDIEKASNILDKVIRNVLGSNETSEREDLNSEDLTNELVGIYTQFLHKQNIFIKSNINNISNDVKNNVKINDSDDFNYIYIELSDVLKNISNNHITSTVITNNITSNELKQVLNKILECNLNDIDRREDNAEY